MYTHPPTQTHTHTDTHTHTHTHTYRGPSRDGPLDTGSDVALFAVVGHVQSGLTTHPGRERLVVVLGDDLTAHQPFLHAAVTRH